ncbi:MAG: penicillin-binding transpeptidase domain-containing protein [Thermodesulfobacteriota bacterium]|nr:penicillin-binding transpeptidase domain-containing protein [Thermodesulfobacteriota bacterium]
MKWVRFRIFIILLVFIIASIAISVRAYQLHVLKNKELSQLTENQVKRVITVAPKRGVIYDCKREEIAISIDVASIYAQPSKITNKREYARKLSRILKIKRRDLIKKLNSDKSFVWIKRKVAPDESKKVESLNLDGINFLTEAKRFYPSREIASNVIGFVGIDSKGLEGLEFNYDKDLKGKATYSSVQRDALGRIIFGKQLKQRKNVMGNELILTIDKTIQYIAEEELRKAVRKTRAKSGTVVVMRPDTGEILAMAIQPQYNPNVFWKYKPSSWRNRAVTDSFEPGSTFKVFLLAAVLEEGVVSQRDIFFCENGSYRVGKNTINDVHPHAWLTIKRIIQYSSNIGVSKVGERLGKEKFHEYIRKFGFGERTNVNLPGETNGLVRSPQNWKKIDMNTISFGQGVSVSAIQLINGLCTIANKGFLMKPYIVKNIVTSDGKVIKEFKPHIVRRVISEKTARDVTSILKSTVKKGGTGTKAFIDGYEVAGKTGTAQKANPYTGGYYKNKYIASFIGFAPADHPQIAILVVIDEPEGTPYGGEVAAPVFKACAEKTLNYMGITPKSILVKRNPDRLKTLIAKKDLKKQRIREFIVPAKSRKFVMPDLTGLSMRQALKVLHGSNIDIKITGSGRAIKQSVKPGRSITDGDKCWIHFQQPL